METAVLDACVLFRGGMRDYLLWAAHAGAFLPAWSDKIHVEWMRNRESAKNPRHRQTPTQTAHTRVQMETAFPGSNMPVDETLLQKIVSMCKTEHQRKDAHVVMTAVVAEASTIVTLNLPDFPVDVLQHYNLRKQTPDDFCARIFPDMVEKFIDGARAQREKMKAPPYTAAEFVDHLARTEFTKTAALLRPYVGQI